MNNNLAFKFFVWLQIPVVSIGWIAFIVNAINVKYYPQYQYINGVNYPGAIFVFSVLVWLATLFVGSLIAAIMHTFNFDLFDCNNVNIDAKQNDNPYRSPGSM